MTMRGINVGHTGLIASSDRLQVISNNLSNLNTSAFKRSSVTFNDIFYQTERLGGVEVQGETTPLNVQFGHGVALGTTPTDFTQGHAILTDETLDVYVQGEGFFRIQDPAGDTFYTRVGEFQPKATGSEGAIHLQSARGPLVIDPFIILPEGGVQPPVVAPDGRVFLPVVDPATGQVANQLVGQFELVRFRNPDGLIQVGDNLFKETAASGPEIVGTPGSGGFGTLVDRTVEASNAELANELVQMIQTSQMFELSSRAIQTGIEEIQTVIALARSRRVG